MSILPESGVSNPANGLMVGLVNFLPRHVLPTSDDGDRFLTRLGGFAPFVDAWADRLRDGPGGTERSMTGGEPTIVSANDIVRGWEKGLAALKAIHHQVEHIRQLTIKLR